MSDGIYMSVYILIGNDEKMDFEKAETVRYYKNFKLLQICSDGYL